MRPWRKTVHSGDGELLMSTEDIVERWKEYLEEPLNLTTFILDRKESCRTWMWAEVTEAVKQLHSGSAKGVVKISSELLKALEVSGAVLADTPLQCCMDICDDALEVAGWGGGFTFQVLAQEVLNSLEISWVRCSGNMELMISCYRPLNLCIFQAKARFVLLTVNQTHFH